VVWAIFGSTREASDEVWELAEVVCSVRIVVLWAMQALGRVSLTLKSVVRESRTREEEWEALMRTPSF
jgi:hypothetical protein